MISRFFKKSLFAVFVTAFLAASLSTGARAEIRTLSLYSVNNKESLTVTYKKDGRYIPSAMQKLNRFFRDWRNDKVTRMDPVTIDLLWELYQDLGAKKPARIISAHRSAATNAMLRRIGRKVARRSMHITGQAIDVSFPGVSLARLRGSALARRIGGVGYYPRSGFVHIDSGTVRNWPRISPLRLASIIKKNRSTIGARYGRRSTPATLVASATKRSSTGPVNIIPRSFRQNPVARVARIPVPRPRPLEVAMAAAAADTFILPAAATPAGKQNFSPRRSLVGNSIGTLLASTNLENNSTVVVQRTNKAGKSSFVGMIRAGTATDVPLLKPMQTTYASNEFWWSGDMNKLIRRDGAPRPFLLGNEAEAATSESVLTGADKSALETMIAALTGKNPPVTTTSRVMRSGKGDSLIVNRAAKSDMFSTRPTNRNWRKVGKASDKLAGSFEAILKSADQPIGFAQ